MTSLTSECYDGTSIVSTLTINKDNKPVVNVEHYRLDEVLETWDVPIPPNSANPEDHLAFEHRSVWRDFNDRKLV